MRCALPALIETAGLIGGTVLEDSHVLSIKELEREKTDEGTERRELKRKSI